MRSSASTMRSCSACLAAKKAVRAFSGTVVVDFKTDRLAPGEEPQRAEEYRPQLEAYAQALERVMEEKVCRKVLYFFSTGATINL